MAKISLRAYQKKLEGLLEENRLDEVTAHSRHILKTCPKNLRAYRQLGAALFAASRWEEAAEVLRRLLGALPQDFEAHSLLAQAYQQLEQYDKAIWHAERAFDQQPNNQDIISLVRSLYRKHRGEEIDRLQLTASALAQQHIRSSLLQEALNVLDTARKRHPKRIDLQLLQARTLWLAGRRTDAAETALEILIHLPYAKTANRIMTELWLSEQRPSDAQLYLGRMEALDPYLAYQLASGKAPADSLVTIEELDYDAVSQQEDIVDLGWLNSLGDADAAEERDFDSDGGIEASGLEALFGMDETATATPPPTATADLEDLLSDNELEGLFNELAGDSPTADAAAAEADESEAVFSLMDESGFFEKTEAALSADDDDRDETWMPAGLLDRLEAAKEAAADEVEPDLTELLEQLDSDDSDNSWLMEIQQGSLEAATEDSPEHIHSRERHEPSGSPEEEWISAAMRGMTGEQDDSFDLFADDEQLQTLLGKVNETQPIHPDDIEFWLNSSDIDFDEEGADAPVDEGADETADFFDVDDLTDNSWLDDDLEDDFGGGDEPTLDLIDDWQSELDDGGDDDYIDWLGEDDPHPSQLDLAEDMGEYGEAASRLSVLADETIGRSDAPDPESDPPSGFTEEGLSSDETARAWGLKDAEQLADFFEDEVELTEAEAAPDWLNAMVPGLDHDADEDTDSLVPEQSAESSGKEFDWLSDIVDEETGEMQAVAPEPMLPTAQRFDFSKPPVWLTELLEASPGKETLATASLPLLEKLSATASDEAVDELNFDVLDLDLDTDNFDFDAPTEKIIPIGAEAASNDISLDELDFDDYFDFDAPTEKMNVISTEELDQEIDFDELGLEDEDFDFDTPTEEIAAVSVEETTEELNFDALDSGDDLAPPTEQTADSSDLPEWLEYDDDFDFSDPDKKDRQAPTV